MRAIKTGDQSNQLKKAISRDQSGTPSRLSVSNVAFFTSALREQERGIKMDEQRKEVEAEDLEGLAKKVEGGDEVTIPKRRITDSLSPEEHKAYNADVEILIDLIHEHEVLNGGVPDKDLAKIIKISQKTCQR